MINNFRLKFGHIPEHSSLSISTTPVTIFVGPNNSGKSRILKEIEQYCRTGNKDVNSLLLYEVEFKGLDLEHATNSIEQLRQPPKPGVLVK